MIEKEEAIHRAERAVRAFGLEANWRDDGVGLFLRKADRVGALLEAVKLYCDELNSGVLWEESLTVAQLLMIERRRSDPAYHAEFNRLRNEARAFLTDLGGHAS